MTERDWYDWHALYDDPYGGMARRLSWVQDRIRAALDEAPSGRVRAISLCAGQGRDLIGVLTDHPRRGDVIARLVELDPRNVEAARRAAASAGLDGVEVVTADASLTSQYADMVPAELVIAAGLFGNMTSADIERTIGYCTQLCATGGTVVWTRPRMARGDPDQVCDWFEERGFERVWVSGPEYRQCCGAHRFTRAPSPLEDDASMFSFIAHDPLTGPPRG